MNGFSQITVHINNSSTPTKAKTMLPSWYVLPNTYEHKMEATDYTY